MALMNCRLSQRALPHQWVSRPSRVSCLHSQTIRQPCLNKAADTPEDKNSNGGEVGDVGDLSEVGEVDVEGHSMGRRRR
jgi:hypothetical protein